MSAEPRATMRGIAAAHSQGEQGLKDNLPALLQVSRCRLTQGTVGGVGGDQRRVERRRAMAAAVGLGRTATMASVRAAGDDVARLFHVSDEENGKLGIDSFGCTSSFSTSSSAPRV